MLILGIETSCDETSASVVSLESSNGKVKVLSNIISSSSLLHAKTGGIIPQTAAREQLRYILPTIKEALETAEINPSNPSIDSIAVTTGPGLIGSLLVGVETAKTLSSLWNKPIIPVNHLIGHIYANFIEDEDEKPIQFPILGLIISGGHTDLILIKNHNQIEWVGGTRDDAAGEAFDKIGRILGLEYPAGPVIEKMAKLGNSDRFTFPRPMVGSSDFDFSFSGLKSSVFRQAQKLELSHTDKVDICAGVQKAISGVLVRKTLKAAVKYQAKSLLLGGGVAANDNIFETMDSEIKKLKINITLKRPQKTLCTDNAAMIATTAFFKQDKTEAFDIQANPSLYF